MPCWRSARAVAVPIRPQPKMTMSSIVLRAGVSRRLHSLAACGDPMTTILSPGRIVSSPRGHGDLLVPDDARDLGVGREHGVLQRGADDLFEALVGGDRLLDVELDDLHLSVREDVGLARRRNADRLRHRERRLALRRDDPVHVELALPPDVEVLLVPGPDDRARIRREPPREHRDDDVDLVARGARDHERGVFEPRLLEHSPAGAVRLDRSRRRTGCRAPRGGRRPVSITVSSCSSWSASTIVEPTCPAPMMKILIARPRLTPPPAGSQA